MTEDPDRRRIELLLAEIEALDFEEREAAIAALSDEEREAVWAAELEAADEALPDDDEEIDAAD